MCALIEDLHIQLKVNGQVRTVQAPPSYTLLNILREDLGLRGTKDGCQEGECGACTVLLDNEPVNACLVLAGQAAGREILTIEGVAQSGNLHPLQKAFVAVGAVQCGFCIPGAILSAFALLGSNPSPTEEEVREALVGNLCRCTGYTKILEAVILAAEEIRDA